ncbi:glutathione S-transferase [Legionella busanensis]|uniref:Glutathione S-transferase n=1 Tax=Legionella busanensis TaxID=190655 RepID=A0A378JKY7_9GAMM|nr:glutathione transferase GstA [Legionella busanensis]STX51401.1 glutathione S-transferase [Legionella busanensis]
MKLYYTQGACSLVERIIINELGLKAQFESVDLKEKRTETGKNYLTINSKGAVPALELDNGEILTENAVILQYLVDEAKATDLLPEIGDLKRYRVLEWVNYITTEVHKSFGALFNPKLSEQVKSNIFIPIIKSKLSFVNQHMQQPYLMGNHFTIADAYLFVMLLWAKKFQLNLSEWPNLEQFAKELNQRASIKKSLQEEGIAFL